MKTVAFHNLGCKVNAYETEAMIQQMESRGYRIVPFEEKADVYVINTCTVTNMADRKSRQMLHRARKRNPEALVVAVGCYVQADPEAAAADAAVDLVVGNDQKGRLAELIEAGHGAVEDMKAPRPYESLSLSGSREHTRAILKIQDGCNQFCSYCLIPYVRGRVRSRRPEEVLLEARVLAAAGFREVVLTGIHLSSYGLDFAEEEVTAEQPYGTALQNIIEQIAAIPQIARIRLGSLEPRIITPEFVQFLASCDKFCPHFHLSLQSGCNDTLARMNRRYTAKEYLEKCRLIRRAFPLAAITTDVIVGFPGETEEEFQQTKAFLEKCQLYEIHIFKYSRRKGTRADRMSGQVPETVKTERSQVLQELTAAQSEAFRQAWKGHTADVLLEECTDGVWTGHTREYIEVQIPDAGYAAGDIVAVEL
ncbi:MAG: tRNA (N(6)-L-threonylcarbamoyladenosine(37)-C(2))-methylthiotransferase MtaB [Lachnospiraceae bacterium]|nr:tRNA (N(6)-L-threonylcarbamoyladenosine(37)-C(2))-methylthiotransferase MtaB [Lachnospiraceae bacterium]